MTQALTVRPHRSMMNGSATCATVSPAFAAAAAAASDFWSSRTLNLSWAYTASQRPAHASVGPWRVWTASRKKVVLRHTYVKDVLIKIAASPEHNAHAQDETISLGRLCVLAAGTPVSEMLPWTGLPFWLTATDWPVDSRQSRSSVGSHPPANGRAATSRVVAFVQQLTEGYQFRPRECQHFYSTLPGIDRGDGATQGPSPIWYSEVWASRAAVLATSRALFAITRVFLSLGGYLDDMQLIVQRSGRVWIVDPRSFIAARMRPRNTPVYEVAPTRRRHSGGDFDGAVTIWATRRQAAALLSMALTAYLTATSRDEAVRALICEYSACDLGCILAGVPAEGLARLLLLRAPRVLSPLPAASAADGRPLHATASRGDASDSMWKEASEQRVIRSMVRALNQTVGGEPLGVQRPMFSYHTSDRRGGPPMCSRCFGLRHHTTRVLQHPREALADNPRLPRQALADNPCDSNGEHILADAPALACAGLRQERISIPSGLAPKRWAAIGVSAPTLSALSGGVCHCSCSPVTPNVSVVCHADDSVMRTTAAATTTASTATATATQQQQQPGRRESLRWCVRDRRAWLWATREGTLLARLGLPTARRLAWTRMPEPLEPDPDAEI